MFVGHLSLALIAKRARPGASLGWYVAATTTLDLLWPLFLLAGLERVSIIPGATAFNPLVFDSYPWSHSLVMAIGWGLVLAMVARRSGVEADPARLVGVLVPSHWVLDWLTHAPDMPLWPGGPRFGLGLWNSIPATLAIEGTLWAIGIALYLGPRRATRWIGPAALWSLVLVCTGMWALGPWSPPPPDPHALALFALIGWLLIPWSALADRCYALRLP